MLQKSFPSIYCLEKLLLGVFPKTTLSAQANTCLLRLTILQVFVFSELNHYRDSFLNHRNHSWFQKLSMTR